MPLRITSIALFFIAASPLPACADPQNTASETSLGTTLHQAVVTVPMDNWGGRPLVHTRVNGKGPFRLLLDTGTTFAAVLSEDLLEELEVPRSGPAPTMGTMGEDDVVELETIVMGDAEFSKIRVGRADFSGFMPPGPATPVGILGLSLFKDCLLTLDYPNRTVVFESGELPPAGDDTIEYSSEEDHDYGITIALSVAGKRTKVHLDTGSPGFLTLLTKMQEKLPLVDKPRVIGMARTPQGNAEIRMATLDGTVTLGPHEFVRPRIKFADLGPMVEHDCGNIGYRLLKDFAVTLDQKNGRVRLRRAKPGGG